MRFRLAEKCPFLRFALVSLSLVIAPWPVFAEISSPRLPSFSPGFSFEAGGLLGLEEPLRGGKASFGFGFPRVPFLPELRLSMIGDVGLSAWLAEASLALGLAGDIALIVGMVHPLGDAEIAAGSGRRLRLAVPDLPSLFGIWAKVSKHPLSKSASLATIVSLEWTAWDMAPPESGCEAIGYASTDALRVFAEGFSASLGLRLEISPAIKDARTRASP